MTLRAALRALRRNKMRSALTTLGIVIGVAAVIAMVSIGRGANVAVQQQIASLGTNLLMVIPGATTSGGARSGWGGMSTLTVRDGEAIRADAPAVEDVTWFKRAIAQVVYGDAELVHLGAGSHRELRERATVARREGQLLHAARRGRRPTASPCSARPSSTTSSAPARTRSTRRSA